MARYLSTNIPKNNREYPFPSVNILLYSIAREHADTFTRTGVELLLAEQARNFERRIADVLAETEYEDLAASFTPKYDADGRILTVDVRYHPLQ